MRRRLKQNQQHDLKILACCKAIPLYEQRITTGTYACIGVDSGLQCCCRPATQQRRLLYNRLPWHDAAAKATKERRELQTKNATAAYRARTNMRPEYGKPACFEKASSIDTNRGGDFSYRLPP